MMDRVERITMRSYVPAEATRRAGDNLNRNTRIAFEEQAGKRLLIRIEEKTYGDRR